MLGRGSRGDGTPLLDGMYLIPSKQKNWDNDSFTAQKCHVVETKQRKIIILGQTRVPSPYQHTTTKAQHCILPPITNSLFCLYKQLTTCFLHIFCFLSLPFSEPIFKPQIK